MHRTIATPDVLKHPDTSLRRGIDFHADKVIIHDLKGVFHKCERCSKYLPSVDTDPVFAMICKRCASAMHTFFYDVAHDVRTNLTLAMAAMTVNDFIHKFVRSEMRHLSFDDIQTRGEYIRATRQEFANCG